MIEALAERCVAAEKQAEYDALVMQVASLCMRRAAADEYTPLAQILPQFADDVARVAHG